MPRRLRSLTQRPTMLALASVLVVLLASGVAVAEPDGGTTVRPVAERDTSTVTVGEVSASLETSIPAIAAGDPFGFTARVRVDSPVSFLQVRLKVYRPTGRLIFQRTRIDNSVPAGTREYSFERETSDLGLRPGTYPVELQVVTQGPEGRLEDVITSELRVYDPDREPTDMVMVARVTGAPLVGPDGRFIQDPAQYSDVLLEVERLVDSAAEKDLRITLAIPPMLLEEWKRVSAGYETESDDGPVEVPADATVPTRYATVLGKIAQAIDAGRVELLSTGYSDPDLSEIAANKLRDDVAVQYQKGLSSSFASLESTPSTGTAPAGGCIPPTAVPQLAAEDLGYVLVESRCVRRGDATVTAGVYRATQTSMTVLVADATAGDAAALGDIDTVTTRAFGRHTSTARAPFIFIADIGSAGRGSAEGFVLSASALTAQPWLKQALGRDVARPARAEVRLVSAAPDRDVPAGYWDAVLTGRQWAVALAEAAGDGRADSMAAAAASLIAESSVWSHADWALSQRGQAYAEAAETAGREALDPVVLALEPITLAGTDGAIPVTISNGSDAGLRVTVTAATDGNLKLTDESEWVMDLKTQENFFEVPVTLQNALTGDLTVTVRSGDVVLEQKTVTVRASYLDRLALIAGVVVLLGGMLAYIIRRVRKAEAGNDVTEGDGRYTEPTETDDSENES